MAADKDEAKAFKRVHFFKYFLSEDDWNARHDYHVQKMRLHTSAFHGMGIQNGDTTLLVKAQATPSLKVEVSPGFGTDVQGREVYVPQAETVTIEPNKLELPGIVYIKVVYQEMASERVRLGDGRIENKYFRETYRFIVSTKPADDNQLELARIKMTPDCKAVKDPKNPEKPTLNEIDMRFRRCATCRRDIDMEARNVLLKLMKDRKTAFDRLGGNSKLPELALLGQNFAIMEELLSSGALREPALGSILQFFSMLDQMVIDCVSRSMDSYSLERPEWKRYVDNCRSFRLLLAEPGKSPLQKLQMALVQLEKMSISYAHVGRLIGNDNRIYIPGQVKPLPRVYPITEGWEFIKVWSAPMPEVFFVDDQEWLLRGELNITDSDSEKKYKFRICEVQDIKANLWKNRQNLYYPDGTLVEDTGVGHTGGYSEYEIANVIPDTPLCIIRRTDYARGDYEMMVNVNGIDAGISQCVGYDRKHRWRNWPFVVPSAFVNNTVVRIKQTGLSADRDINMFRYWFYQPVVF